MLPRNPTTPSLMMLALALTISLPAAAVVAPADSQVYTVSPNPATADTPFTLSLSGGSYGCASTFTHQSVSVTGNRIDLSFVAGTGLIIDPPVPLGSGTAPTSPDIVCPVYNSGSPSAASPILLSVPTFSMPALKAGQYEVWAAQLPACAYADPSPCKVAIDSKYAGVLTVQAGGTITYSINPTETEAGQDFTLNLLSYQFNCANTFDMLGSTVNGNTISLTFLDHEKTGVACPDIYMPYGPAFKMSALKAGNYNVVAYRLPACAAQGCKTAPVAADAGTLVVKGAGEKDGWFLKDKQVLPNKAFTMQLLNNAYGNCQTKFSNQSVDVTNGSITASFQIGIDTGRVCIADIHPYGPSFDMQALKPGAYPVRVNTATPCPPNATFCPLSLIVLLPVDTLIVTPTAAILLHGVEGTSLSASFQGRSLNLALPAGPAGLWRAEILTLSGQVLGSYDVNKASASSASGGTISMDAGARIERGIYLVRISSPSGETHLLPVVRKD